MVWQLLEIEGRDRNHPRRGGGGGGEEAEQLINKSTALGFSGQSVGLRLNSPGGCWEGEVGAFFSPG